MTSIAQAARQALDVRQVTDDDAVHQCFDWLLSEILDNSITEAGRKLAIEQPAAGLRFRITWPS